MSEQDSLARAKAVALRFLAARARTEVQVRARLSRAGLESEAGEVVGWLTRFGYLDDAEFALARARALLVPGKLGPRLAERRIEAAGISREEARAAVREALRELGQEGDAEVALCRALAARRMDGRSLATLDARERGRLARYLLGRGFSERVVGDVLGGVLGLAGDA